MKPFEITIIGPDGCRYTLTGTTTADVLPETLAAVFKMREEGLIKFNAIKTSHDEMTVLRSMGKLESASYNPETGRYQEVVNLSSGREPYWGPLVRREKTGGKNVVEFLEEMVQEDLTFEKEFQEVKRLMKVDIFHKMARMSWDAMDHSRRYAIHFIRSRTAWFAHYIFTKF